MKGRWLVSSVATVIFREVAGVTPHRWPVSRVAGVAISIFQTLFKG